jgi:hypothetical protein
MFILDVPRLTPPPRVVPGRGVGQFQLKLPELSTTSGVSSGRHTVFPQFQLKLGPQFQLKLDHQFPLKSPLNGVSERAAARIASGKGS